MDDIAIAYQGEIVGQVYEGNRVFNLTVALAPEEPGDLTAVGGLPLRAPSGLSVRLAEVADITQVVGRSAVAHEGAQRVQTVTCNVIGRPVTQFVSDAERAVRAQVKLPANAYVAFTGTAEEQARVRRDLIIHAALTFVAIVLFLSMVVGRGRNLILMLTSAPFALVGGVLAVFVTGAQLSIGSLVGFVTLLGISLRNAMMMIAHYEHLVQFEGATWGPETARRGAAERLSPILMTALVTGLGLLPLALGAGAPGREIEGPMAVVILGGLVTSTAMNLLVLPAFALCWGCFGPSGESAVDAEHNAE
jgi:Cu/Ag efflux pump CusA